MAGHEIKTPVTIIDADVEILSMEIGSDNEWLRDIGLQTKRMTALTNDLLTLSRMDENRQQYTMIDFPISDVVEETVMSFQTLAQSRKRLYRSTSVTSEAVSWLPRIVSPSQCPASIRWFAWSERKEMDF